MMKEEYLAEAREELRRHWDRSIEDGLNYGDLVISAAEGEGEPMGSISFKEFLNDCSACGGNWGGMLLTGIKRRWPTVWHAIPDDMGVHAFACILDTLMLCGVDTAE